MPTESLQPPTQLKRSDLKLASIVVEPLPQAAPVIVILAFQGSALIPNPTGSTIVTLTAATVGNAEEHSKLSPGLQAVIGKVASLMQEYRLEKLTLQLYQGFTVQQLSTHVQMRSAFGGNIERAHYVGAYRFSPQQRERLSNLIMQDRFPCRIVDIDV